MLQYKIIPVTVFQQNCTLFWCDKTMEAAIVDPGGDIERLQAEIEKAGVDLKKIWITHAHLDHAGATHDLAQLTGAEIEGPHKEDQFWIDMMPQMRQRPGFEHCKVFFPDRWLAQGDTVEIGEEILEVYFCPGHTPGHIVFYHRPSKLAQVGDVLFRGSIGRTDFPRGDFNTLMQSIKGTLWSLGDDTRFIPGHGPMGTFGEERRTNPFVGDGVR